MNTSFNSTGVGSLQKVAILYTYKHKKHFQPKLFNKCLSCGRKTTQRAIKEHSKDDFLSHYFEYECCITYDT